MKNTIQESEKENLDKIIIKGTNDGLLIIFPDSLAWNDLVQQLSDILDGSKNFWIGASTSVDLGGHKLDETQIKRLHEMLNKRYHLNLGAIYAHNNETRTFAEKNGLKTGDAHPNASRNTPGNEIVNSLTNSSNAIYLKQTIRSGQSIRFDGNVVIYGDTNPGSEIIASGDIVVLGSLRGIAHAGAKGDENSQIAALSLRPTQLRIASYIGRPPDEQNISAVYPEYAWISNGEIHIAPLKSKK